MLKQLRICSSISSLSERQYWGSDLQLPEIPFEEIMSNDESAYKWLCMLKKVGIVLLTGAATRQGELIRLGHRIGFLRLTFYGWVWFIISLFCQCCNHLQCSSSKLAVSILWINTLKQGVSYFLYILENLASSLYTVQESCFAVTGRDVKKSSNNINWWEKEKCLKTNVFEYRWQWDRLTYLYRETKLIHPVLNRGSYLFWNFCLVWFWVMDIGKTWPTSPRRWAEYPFPCFQLCILWKAIANLNK